MIARRKFRTEQARKRENIRFSLRVGAYLCIALFSFGILQYVFHLDSMRIREIYVETDGVLEYDMVATAIGSELEGTYFGIIPKNSVTILSFKDLSQDVRMAFPRIDEISIQKPDMYALKAEIRERKPAALWCGDVVPEIAYTSTEKTQTKEQLWGTCYLMDKSGYIYAKAPIYSGGVYPRYYGPLEHAEPIGQYYIDMVDFARWQEFYHSTILDDIKPQAVLFFDMRDAELYLTNGYRVLLPRDEDMEVLQRRLMALFESDSIDDQKTIEYIDLRFGNKAYIKYAGEQTEI